jgi:hypothetical protein
LPKDSAITSNWHDPDNCEGTDDCSCKEPQILTKETIDRLLFQHLPEERVAADKFKRLCIWGSRKVFSCLVESKDIKSWIENAIKLTHSSVPDAESHCETLNHPAAEDNAMRK